MSRKPKTFFVKNPYHSEHGLVYKTGDLVHWNKEGLLVYHGRCDSMIKSRGYRIELGEIETVLLAHEKIKEVVVTTIPSEEFGTIIKAVLVTKFDVDLNETAIRRFLRGNPSSLYGTREYTYCSGSPSDFYR